MPRAIVLHADDNVATLIDAGVAGEVFHLSGAMRRDIELTEAIPYGHKCVIAPVASGQPIVKYGQVIGRATTDIAAGRHAHVHNVEALRGRGDLEGASQ